jgi:LuxR family maltose regulon positive regulatory protein
LLNALAEHAEHVALILDDYHTVTNPSIHEGISFLIDHAPPLFHLVLASRIDPPLPLARWRARGELIEIRAADLRFTVDEAVRFFAETMGINLDTEAAAALDARTEGWAAALQLAALSLQGQTDVRGFIDTFSGSHRHVVDYLAEEVLGRQSDHIRTFLLQTAILERMCGPLCDAVLGLEARDMRREVASSNRTPQTASSDSYSRLILDELERANLFLIPLDEERRWYRYHHLFADLLRHRLGQEHPDAVAELHGRAARWFAQQGMVAEAVEHGLAASDIDLVVDLLSAHAVRFAASGETQTLQRWLDALPREQLLGNPRLCLAQAQVLLLNRQVVAIEPYVQAAEAALAAMDAPDALALRGELLTQRAHVAIERGAFDDALTLAREAQTLLPATEHWPRSSNGLVLGYALMVLGHTREATAVHAENITLARAVGNAVSGLFSATEVVKLQLLQGRLSEARASAERALAWVATEGWEQLAPASALHIWLGNVLIEQGDFLGAGEQLAHAIGLTQHGPAITAARAQAFLARLRQIQGEHGGANAAVAAVEDICRGWEPGGERAFFEAYVARVRLLQGDMAAARRWVDERRPWDRNETASYFREIELLTLARVAVLDVSGSIDNARLAEILALLEWLRDHALAGGRGAVVIETLVLEALALSRGGEAAQAHRQLDEALAEAAPEGFVGLFVDFGAPLADLLMQNLARHPANDPLRLYRRRLLDMFGIGTSEQASPPMMEHSPQHAVGVVSPEAEALTERELEVLRLFAAGMTSPEIAGHFVVSINTVKTQLKSIYAKLDAHSRAEAIAKGRARQLLQ